MQRTPEPEELMDQHDQALAYANADFDEANSLFIELLSELCPGTLQGRALDLGCGPADIPLRLLDRHPALFVDALDGARAMLELAGEKASLNPDHERRLALRCEILPCPSLVQQGYDYLLSNSLLHHLSDPADLWKTVRHCAREGAGVLIMDLARPSSPLAVDALVETYALNEPDVLREDFRNSLHAAYTAVEVERQLVDLGLEQIQVSMVSDRHWAARGRL